MAQSANVAVLPANYPQRGQSSSPMVADAEWNIQGSLTAGRIIPFFKIPAGVRIRQLIYDFPILDTNGTPTVTVSIGIAGSTQLFLATTSALTAATKGYILATPGLNYITTAETVVNLYIVAAAATTNPAPATPLYLSLEYKDA